MMKYNDILWVHKSATQLFCSVDRPEIINDKTYISALKQALKDIHRDECQ